MDDPRTPAVHLRAAVTVRGRLMAATQAVLPQQWADEQMRGHLRAMLRGQLEDAALREFRDLSQVERERIDNASVEVREDND